MLLPELSSGCVVIETRRFRLYLKEFRVGRSPQSLVRAMHGHGVAAF